MSDKQQVRFVRVDPINLVHTRILRTNKQSEPLALTINEPICRLFRYGSLIPLKEREEKDV